MGQTDMKRENPHSALVASLDAEGLALLSAALDERACREELGFGTFAEAAELFRPEPACPRCGSSPWRDGREPSGLRRWRCRSCGARFASLTGTVFEGSRAGLPTWARFIRPMGHNVPLDCAAELCGVSHQTAFEWRRRVLATVSGYQGRIVLRDRAWIDETYVNDTDPSKGYGQARKRGPSRQRLCILVAIDVRKSPTAAVCGHGKPSSARVRSALAGHLSPGCVVVHDRGAGPQRGHRRQRLRLGVLQGRLPRPGLPRGDGDGQQHVPLAQALPLAVHRHVAGQHAAVPGLVRLPVQGQPGEGQVGPDRKGPPPHDDGPGSFPQFKAADQSPI